MESIGELLEKAVALEESNVKTNGADEILNTLSSGGYLTKDNKYLVSSDYSNELQITRNPLWKSRFGGIASGTITLDKDLLRELNALLKLKTAKDEAGRSNYRIESAIEELTQIKEED